MHNFFNSFTDLIGYSLSKLPYSFLYVHSENLVLQQDDREHLMLFPLPSPSKLTYSFLYVHSENLVLQQDDREHLMLFPLLITCLLQDLKLFEGGTCLSNELKS